jgi:hypothetical protein
MTQRSGCVASVARTDLTEDARSAEVVGLLTAGFLPRHADPGSARRLRLQLSQPSDELAREVLVQRRSYEATRLPILAANS